MNKLLYTLLGAIVIIAAGCSNPIGPAASIYTMSFNAGVPISKSYSKSYVVMDTQSVMQSNTGTRVAMYSIVGWGQCSCGAETPQAYLICDTLNGSKPYNPTANSYVASDSNGNSYYTPSDSGDSGNFGMKIIGDETEPFVRGFVTVDTMVKSISQIVISFHGFVISGGDTVLITNGTLTAPPEPAANTGTIELQ